ncbi:MAG: GTP-binding protein [Candidatus Hydrothermarchaeaceae archaeon]
MGSGIDEIEELARNGETANVEFKEYLKKKVHLEKVRMQGLASQMRYRVLSGNGRAIYLIGVNNKGVIKGLSQKRYKETVEVLDAIAWEAGLSVVARDCYPSNGGVVGKLVIEESRLEKEHLLIGTAGHVDHGKSTLVGTLVSGELDDGDGRTRRYLDTQKHEIERGLSADLSYAVYGFDGGGNALRLKNPLSKKERAGVVEKAGKIVSFVDTVGHEPWLRTTIRGIVGQTLDYGILTIAADDGITHVTKEHLAILLAMELPVVIAVTKCDHMVRKNLDEEIADLLALVGKVPKFLRSVRDVEMLQPFWENKVLVPVVRTSAKTGEGFEVLDKLFLHLPKGATRFEREKDFLMYIDKVYNVPGVGTVVSGSIKQGVVKKGVELFLGPDSDGVFHGVRVASLEIHHFSVDTSEVGGIIGIALKNVDMEIRRGLVLAAEEGLKASREFEADVVVLNHPTRIAEGYEPVVHLETISESIEVTPLDAEFLAAGDRGRVRMRFKYNPYYVKEGQKFVFREGRSKGIGTVIKIIS